jgi:ubiquinone/menaquinone biosynthesis C-methylase UbiE
VSGRHVVARAESLPFDDGEFDVIVSAWMLEAVNDVTRALAECVRTLAPGGTLLLCFCSAPSSLWSRVRATRLSFVLWRGFAGRLVDPAQVLVAPQAQVWTWSFGAGRATLMRVQTEAGHSAMPHRLLSAS